MRTLPKRRNELLNGQKFTLVSLKIGGMLSQLFNVHGRWRTSGNAGENFYKTKMTVLRGVRELEMELPGQTGDLKSSHQSAGAG